MNKQACAAQHFGFWMVQPRWMSAAAAAYNAGTLPKVTVDAETGDSLYEVTPNGIAVVDIDGQITKGRSSFGGTSSVIARRALREAHSDGDVRGIMLRIDSPGGTVAGLMPFADEVFRIRKSGNKPIVAHGDDLVASSAYWVGSQAETMTASPMTEVGSIGTVAQVVDTSERDKSRGVTVHTVSTGPMKGAFFQGTEITDEQLEWLQGRVNELNGFFLNGVKRGRAMPIDKVRESATGEDWLAADAEVRGLIDGVMSFEEAMISLARTIETRERERARESASRRRRAAIAEMN